MVHIVLDMDGTLVSHDAFAHPRPGLAEFLDFCFANFHTVSIWSAADRVWISNILSGPVFCKYNFHLVWTRNECVLAHDIFTKPLSKIRKNLPEPNDIVLIVDDTPETAYENPELLVRISTYTTNPSAFVCFREDMFLDIEKHRQRKQATQDFELDRVAKILSQHTHVKI